MKATVPLFLSARNFFVENLQDFHVTVYIKTILSDWRSLILNYNFLKGTWALQRVTHNHFKESLGEPSHNHVGKFSISIVIFQLHKDATAVHLTETFLNFDFFN